MHLAILSQYYPPEVGAPQNRLSELAARFRERGHQVTVLTALPNYPTGRIYPGYGGLGRVETLDGVRVVRAPLYPSQSARTVPRLASYFSFVATSLVAGLARLRKVDVLLTESPPLFLGLSGYLLSRLKRARFVFNVADLWPRSAIELGMVSQGPALSASLALEAFCYRKAWLVTGQSRGILEDIERRFPKVRTHHLSNGVDPERFAAPRRAKGGDRCVAVYAGLHGVAQGLGQVLDAADRLCDLPGLEIVLAGDGPEKEALVRRAADLGLPNVLFLEPLPKAEIPDLLASADIALACLARSLRGAVPSKIYEAMAASLPLVLVADGEPARLVREHGAGVVVEPGDVDGLAAALRELAGDPDRRRELGENGRRAAETVFNRQRIVDRFLDVLERELER